MKFFISFLLLFSLPLFADDTREAKFLGGYKAMVKALVADDFATAQAVGEEQRVLVEEWLQEELEVGWRKYLEGAARALQDLGRAKEATQYRAAFADYSEGILSYIRDLGLTQDWQLFFCPMFEGYAYWAQPTGETIANPYMGKEMPKCGVKKKWESLPPYHG